MSPLSRPVMNKDRSNRPRGSCPECGKSIMLRNSDGMISKHGPGCLGALRAPTRASQFVFQTNWTPPRRSE